MLEKARSYLTIATRKSAKDSSKVEALENALHCMLEHLESEQVGVDTVSLQTEDNTELKLSDQKDAYDPEHLSNDNA